MSKVRTHVEASPGQTVEQIGKALGMTTKDLARPIAKLLGDGKLTKTGIKRQTKYFPPEKAPKAAAKKTATKRTTRAPAKKTATKAPAKKRRSKR